MCEFRPEASSPEARGGLEKWLCRRCKNKNQASGCCRRKRGGNIPCPRGPKRQRQVSERVRRLAGQVESSHELLAPADASSLFERRQTSSARATARVKPN